MFIPVAYASYHKWFIHVDKEVKLDLALDMLCRTNLFQDEFRIERDATSRELKVSRLGKNGDPVSTATIRRVTGALSITINGAVSLSCDSDRGKRALEAIAYINRSEPTLRSYDTRIVREKTNGSLWFVDVWPRPSSPDQDLTFLLKAKASSYIAIPRQMELLSHSTSSHSRRRYVHFRYGRGKD